MSFLHLAYVLMLVPSLFVITRLRPRYRPVGLVVLNLLFYSTWSIRLLGVVAMSSLVCWLIIRGYKYAPQYKLFFRALGWITHFLFIYYVNSPAGYATFQSTVGVLFLSLQAISLIEDGSVKNRWQHIKFYEVTLYISYFPLLLAGPIEKSTSLIPQFSTISSRLQFDKKFFWWVFWGYIQKSVLSLTLYSEIVRPLQISIESGRSGVGGFMLFGFSCLLMVVTDFGGYSDLARGYSHLIGIELTRNFKNPLLATSAAQFWSQCHISFHNWLKKYLFLPLLSVFKGHRWSFFAALTSTFMVAALAHGFTQKYLIWGLLNSAVFVFYHFSQQRKWFFTENVIVSRLMSLIFFSMLGAYFLSSDPQHFIHLISNSLCLNVSSDFLYLAHFVILTLPYWWIQIVENNKEEIILGGYEKTWSFALLVFILMVWTLGFQSSSGQFIYFQF